MSGALLGRWAAPLLNLDIKQLLIGIAILLFLILIEVGRIGSRSGNISPPEKKQTEMPSTVRCEGYQTPKVFCRLRQIQPLPKTPGKPSQSVTA